MNLIDQERNFRTQYYEKVGFRAVDEKKSVETLLKDTPIKKDKLQQFCLLFGIPAVYRNYVWKLLLDILPVSQSSHEFAWSHRSAQVSELQRAVRLVRPGCEGLEQTVMRMWLIEGGRLGLSTDDVEADPTNLHFLHITQAVSAMTSSETDLYWLATRFFKHLDTNIYSHIATFPSQTMQCVSKEDADQRLYNHLKDLHICDTPLINQWFYTCFASVLPELALERIWDRVIAGSAHVLVYVAVSILVTLRRPLLALTTTSDMVNYLKKIPEDCGDRIVNEALELLHKYCQCDSPGGLDQNRGGKASDNKSLRTHKDVKSAQSVTIEIARKSPAAGDKA